MTGLLVSVRNVAEARDALAGGADVIDIKEPKRGALGAADAKVWRAVVAKVDGRVPVSAALGELAVDAAEQVAAVVAGIGFVKIGLARCAAVGDWRARWQRARELLPAKVQIVPVAYGDWRLAEAPSPDEVLELARSSDSRMMLVDTYSKSAGNLLDLVAWKELLALSRNATDAGVRLVLAGSLAAETIGRVWELQPAYVGVRGAACHGGREGRIDRELVRALAELIRSRDPLFRSRRDQAAAV